MAGCGFRVQTVGCRLELQSSDLPELSMLGVPICAMGLGV